MEGHQPATAHSDTTEFQQLSSLYRLLKRAVATRSEREILRTFIEALAVWQDAESMAYVADVNGHFVLDLILPGSDRESVPGILDIEPGDDMTTMRLPPAEREAMGFLGPTDVILSRVRGRVTSDWLIASRAPADSLAEARLAVYVEAVSQALTEMTAVESSRLTWAMLQHLLPTSEALDRAAQGAIDALASVVGGEIFLSVTRDDGSRVLTIGDVRGIEHSGGAIRTSALLAIPVDVPAPFASILGVRRKANCPLTGREERLLHSAASTLGAWLGMVAPKFQSRHDRRLGPRTFDHVVEQQAREAQAHDRELSVIVVLLGADPPEHQVTHACVVQIRGLLRPADMAGRLSSGHIGVVLPDTPHDGATVVAERLRQLVKGDPGFGSFPDASIVFANPTSSGSTGIERGESQFRDAYSRMLGNGRLVPGPPN
jgi:hypothetical protein